MKLSCLIVFKLESSRDQLQNEEDSFPGIYIYIYIPPEKAQQFQWLFLNNKMLGWWAALRKILVVVFGVNVLANYCAMGKRNTTFNKLDLALLRSIKVIYAYTAVQLCHWSWWASNP